MSLVTLERLHRYMNSPEWTEEQKDAIGDILRGVQGQLEGCLSGANLVPRQMYEVAPILPSGLLATRQPVFSVQKIDSVVVDGTHPLQLPWVHTEHRLRHTSPAGYLSGVLALPSTTDAWGAASVPRVENVGRATVLYMGGWGENPAADGTDNPALCDTSALVLAILAKAKAIVRNRFDDSIVINGTDNENAPRLERETWSKEELAPLGIFRNIGARR